MINDNDWESNVYNCTFQHSLKIIELSQKAKSEDDIARIIDVLHDIISFESAAIFVASKQNDDLNIKQVFNHSYNQDLLDRCMKDGNSHFSLMMNNVIQFNRPMVWNDMWQPAKCPSSFGVVGAIRCFGDAQGIMFPFSVGQSSYSIATLSMEFKRESDHIYYGNRFLSYISALLQYPCKAVNRIISCRYESGVNLLTSRETQVLEWAAKGKTAWEVATILSISERTVKFHLTNIYQKLNVINRQQAIAKALHSGIFTFE